MTQESYNKCRCNKKEKHRDTKGEKNHILELNNRRSEFQCHYFFVGKTKATNLIRLMEVGKSYINYDKAPRVQEAMNTKDFTTKGLDMNRVRNEVDS